MNTDWRGAPCLHPSVNRRGDLSPVDTAGKLDEPRARRIAAKLCGRCPARRACLDSAQQLRDAGTPPQEIIWAGLWWPVSNARDTTPIDLLAAAPAEADTSHEKAAAA